MKRIVFYSLLAGQLLVLVLLTIQFEQIDTKGQTITLQTTEPKDYMDYTSYNDSLYVEYEINKVENDLWIDADSLEWGDRVYALLTSEGDDVYTTKQASTQKLTASSDNEIVLIGKYQYEDPPGKFTYVEFGIGKINNVDQFGSFNNKQPLRITLKIGKWGQHKVVSIDQTK